MSDMHELNDEYHCGEADISFYDNPAVVVSRDCIENEVLKGELSATQAAQRLLNIYATRV